MPVTRLSIFLFALNWFNLEELKIDIILKKLFYLVSFLAILAAVPSYGQVDDIAGRSSLFYYSGTLGDVDEIEFNMQVEGQIVTGSYIIENSGDLFIFSGRLSADQNAFGVLVYFHGTDEYVGTIEAQISSNENNFMKSISGQWKNADGDVTKLLSLNKVAELTKDTSEPSETMVWE